MSLQVCSRCRKRRIRCDLQLPACRNCQVADVECLFWDDSLGQEISCSYVHSLRQKVKGLELEIQYATVKGRAMLEDHRDGADSVQLPELGYHLNIFDYDDLPSSPRTAYLGLGNSAWLLEHLLKIVIRWHVANNVQIPERLLLDEPSQLTGNEAFKPLPSFTIMNDQRKLELQSLVPPSTQRAIIEQYLKTVSPEYALLSPEEESALLMHENPLKWSSSNGSITGAFAISIVFVISTALVVRDLDPNLSIISIRCAEEMQKLIQRSVSPRDPIEVTKQTCTALCALALCELTNPVSGQLWDLLGRAVSTMDHLREGYQLRCMSLDNDFRRLECAVLKLECSAALHLRRPTYLCEKRLRTIIEDDSIPDAMSGDLRILSYLHNIAHAFVTLPRPSEDFVESLIPEPMQVRSKNSDITLPSAILYSAMHPLFTTLDPCCGRMLDEASLRLFHVIARSACTIIDHFVSLNKSNRIISLWMAAERVLEGGAIWATYLMSQHHTTSTEEQFFSNIETRIAMGPISKVSALLASFETRWKDGSVYMDVWEAFVELVWNVL